MEHVQLEDIASYNEIIGLYKQFSLTPSLVKAYSHFSGFSTKKIKYPLVGTEKRQSDLFIDRITQLFILFSLTTDRLFERKKIKTIVTTSGEKTHIVLKMNNAVVFSSSCASFLDSIVRVLGFIISLESK